MSSESHKYHPISCEFHDVLEALATTHKPAQLRFLDAQGAEQQCTAVITDVYARDGAEYLSMDSGEVLRLDRLVAVDSEKLADY